MIARNRGVLCFTLLWLSAAAACTQAAGLDGSYSAANQPCDDGAECASGVCNGAPGWCEESCAVDGDCPAGACVENGNGVSLCFPACATDADCAVYGVTNLACTAVTTVSGSSALVCSVPPT